LRLARNHFIFIHILTSEWTFMTHIDRMTETPQGQLQQDLDAITARFNLGDSGVSEYLRPDEELIGFGNGGSESLVMFVKCPQLGSLVRKVCSESLASVDWDPNGTGVMSPPSTKGGLQADYLLGLPESVKPYFPAVHNVQVVHEEDEDGKPSRKIVYDQSVLKGVEVSTFVAEAQPTPEVVRRLHHEVMRLLAEQVHPHRETLHVGDSIRSSHLDKIAARLELSRATTPETFSPLLDAERIVINGTVYRNIDQLLAFFKQPHVAEMLEPKYHSLVMGDTNTENVMITNVDVLAEAMADAGKLDFTYDDIGLKFLDPRAIGHATVGKHTCDDRMYDNKPVHNTLGNYDVVHGEYFSIAVNAAPTPEVTLSAHADHPYTEPYKGMANSDYFKQVMDAWNVSHPEFLRDDPNWLLRFTFMMGSHFAAMPPFHFKRNSLGEVPEDVEAQKRAIAIYCEGVKWLNRAHDMITGDRMDLYGVPLQPLQASVRQ
jgi:hypothetical protein